MLALFDLADVNPRRINVAVHRRARPKLPTFVELTRVRGEVKTTRYEGLESQTVADSLLECRGSIEGECLLEAAKQARAEGLLTTTEWEQLRKEILR